MFTKDIGIDLGTANTLVYMKGRGIIMREPSVAAVDPRSDELRVRSVGHEAKAVIGRAPGSIVAVRPLKDGVIADFDVTAAMLQSFIRQACGNSILARPRVVICVPSGVTEVERRAVRQAAAKAGARQVTVIEEPMAAAIGSGPPTTDAVGSMIVDIGGGTTGTAVISNGKVIASVDDATGGHHVTLAMSGALSVPYEEAELKKRGTDNRQYAPIVKPVFERISDIVKAHISGHAVDTVYLTGGTCCFPGIAPLFEKELGIKVECPDYPLLLTPLAIACLPLMEG